MMKRFTSMGMAAALLSSVLSVATPAMAEVCADAKAREALELRVLQSELMVAALTCSARPSYNRFVTTYKPYLKSQGSALRTFFSEKFGPNAGPQRLNKMVTRLANAASQQSLSQSRQAYCDAAKARFETILRSDPKTLAHMARINPAASKHGYKACVEMAGGEVDMKLSQSE